jgi:hypothetical protein
VRDGEDDHPRRKTRDEQCPIADPLVSPHNCTLPGGTQNHHRMPLRYQRSQQRERCGFLTTEVACNDVISASGGDPRQDVSEAWWRDVPQGAANIRPRSIDPRGTSTSSFGMYDCVGEGEETFFFPAHSACNHPRFSAGESRGANLRVRSRIEASAIAVMKTVATPREIQP